MSNYQLLINSPQLPEGYKQTEVGVIPEDWEVKLLGEIVIFTNGKAHERDIKETGKYIVANSKFISTEGRVKKYSHLCHCPTGKDNILMVMSDVPNGRAIAKCFFVDKDDTYTVNQRICSLKVLGENCKFVFYQVDKNSFYLEFDDGVKQTNLRRGEVLSCPLPMPGLQEQQLIAEALSDVDALIAALDKLIAKKRHIKTATMQQLLTGKKRLPGFGEGKGYKKTDIGVLPEDWEIKTYQEIFFFLKTANNSRADLSSDEEVKYIHYGDIHTKWEYKIDLHYDFLPSICEEKIKGVTFLEEGDIVMADASEDYEGIGKSVEVVNIGKVKVVAGLHTFLLRDKEKMFVDGFRRYLHTIKVVKLNIDKMATGLKVYGISKTSLKNIYLPIPKKEEQCAIAQVLSDMDEEIIALEKRRAKTQAIKQGMMQELLTGRTRLSFDKA